VGQRDLAAVEHGLDWPAVGQLAVEARAALVFYFIDESNELLLTWVVRATDGVAANANLHFKATPLPAGLGAEEGLKSFFEREFVSVWPGCTDNPLLCKNMAHKRTVLNAARVSR
jgi:hypothetical protein